MTASSLYILAWPQADSAADLENPGLEAATLRNLSLHADKCGAWGLRFWAEKHQIPLHYVDNSWVRADVNGAKLQLFITEVLKDAVTLGPEFAPDGRYVIEAEEF